MTTFYRICRKISKPICIFFQRKISIAFDAWLLDDASPFWLRFYAKLGEPFFKINTYLGDKLYGSDIYEV